MSIKGESDQHRLTGTKQWAPVSENCILGCKNDCRYCYAKKNAVRFGRKTKENWHEMAYNPNCEVQIRKHKGRIMFPTSHDLHIEHVDWWMPFLRGLLVKGNEILIVSKPQYAAVYRMCRELTEYMDQIEFRFTIGTADDTVRKFWEQNAPSIHERMAALMMASIAGYKTSVSMEPLLDYNPAEVIRAVDPHVTGEIWIGMMNHMSRSDFAEDELDWYNRMENINSLENIRKVYEQFKDHPKVRWKDSIETLLGL